MAEIREGEGRGQGSAGVRNWTGWYGWLKPSEFTSGYCVIDSLTYGVGSVTWYAPGGGRRELGLRPLWPDAERERTYQDFYSKLQASVDKWGFKTPILAYRIKGTLYCRYGASRLWVAKKLGDRSVPAIVCDMDCEQWDLNNWVPLRSPHKVMEALGDPLSVGTFEVTHERIDIHNVVPWGEG